MSARGSLRRRAAAAALALASLLACGPARSQVVFLGPELLPKEEAFALRAELADGQVGFTVDVADGYYLYRDRTSARVLAGAEALGELALPPGKIHVDEFFGEVETWRGTVAFAADLAAAAPGQDVQVELTTQGCADAGVCYPPYVARLTLPAGGGGHIALANVLPTGVEAVAEPFDNTDASVAALQTGSLPLVFLAFFSAGLLLAFTPCVLPMVPIALAIATGGSQPGGPRAVGLGLVYVLTMALIYSGLGVAVAASGDGLLAGSLQSPLVLVPLAALFLALGAAVLANASFGLVPAAVARRIAALRSKPGTFGGAAVAGVIAAVVVSPCVAAPLAGALLFIATTGDVFVGGAGLFFLALGMGVLPLACACGAAGLLPRSGPLSEAVKKVFGLLMIALAVWVLGPLAPPPVKFAAYSALAFACAVVFFLAASKTESLRLQAPLAVVAALLFVGVGSVYALGLATKATNEFAPLANLGGATGGLEFETVATEAGYRSVAQGGELGTFEYFYADWCISCRELEGLTFNDPEVMEALQGYRLVKLDLTANDAEAHRLLEMNRLFGPPALILKNANGRQLLRLVGYFDSELLLDSMARFAAGPNARS